MAVIRAHWKRQFQFFPSWTCPTCLEGTLKLDKGTFQSVETGPSSSAHSHEAWEPEWIERRFIGLLRCQNGGCGDLVAINGDASISFQQDHNGDVTSVEKYTPQSLFPGPPVFVVSPKCPSEVMEALAQSFRLLWSDTEAAGNRLRSAVEALLTDQGIARTTLSSKGKRQPLTLHARIEKYRVKNPEAAELIMAIKWFGNAGSHTVGGADRDTLLDAFELIEHAIDIIYVRRSVTLKKVARAMTARKGRPAKSVRSKRKSV